MKEIATITRNNKKNDTVAKKKNNVAKLLINTIKKYIGGFIKYLTLIIFALLVILPVGWAILSAFKTTAEIELSPFSFPQKLQFVNFSNAWVAANMGSYFINSIILTLGSLALLLVISVPAAYALVRFRYKFLKIFSFIFMAGLFVNMNYIVMPLYLMIFSVSRGLGLGAGLVNNQITVMLIYSVTSLSFTIYLLSGYFKALTPDFEEAAKIDGCNRAQILFKIVVPLAMPSVLTVIMFNFLGFWNEYLVANTFLSNELRTLPAGLLNIMRESKVANDLGRMYAGLVIVIVPVIIVYSFVQGQLTKGLTMGGVKG